MGQSQSNYQSPRSEPRLNGPLFGGHHPGDFSIRVRPFHLVCHRPNHQRDALWNSAPSQTQSHSSGSPSLKSVRFGHPPP